MAFQPHINSGICSQDYACVNQDDPTPGVSALPIVLILCDAVISLLDDGIP